MSRSDRSDRTHICENLCMGICTGGAIGGCILLLMSAVYYSQTYPFLIVDNILQTFTCRTCDRYGQCSPFYTCYKIGITARWDNSWCNYSPAFYYTDYNFTLHELNTRYAINNTIQFNSADGGTCTIEVFEAIAAWIGAIITGIISICLLSVAVYSCIDAVKIRLNHYRQQQQAHQLVEQPHEPAPAQAQAQAQARPRYIEMLPRILRTKYSQYQSL